MSPLFRTLVLGCAALALSACALFDNPRDRALRQTPSYRDGYEDGCASANNEASGYRYQGTIRDPSMAKTDSVYRAGWNNGFSACRLQRTTGMGTLTQPVPNSMPGMPDQPDRPQ